MEQEQLPPITPEEARASLAEIDRVVLLTRQTIARAGSAPIVIMWGCIWIVGYSSIQFFPRVSQNLWMILNVVGIGGSIIFGRWTRKLPTKNPNNGRVGLSWLVLFAFAAIWLSLLGPWDLIRGQQLAYAPVFDRKISAFFATVPMFAYIVMGLWLDRFFIWLGVLVTLATLIGYYCIHEYFFLWMAVMGGGSLVAGGLFIQKNWK